MWNLGESRPQTILKKNTHHRSICEQDYIHVGVRTIAQTALEIIRELLLQSHGGVL